MNDVSNSFDNNTDVYFKEFQRICPKNQEPVLSLLRGHLLTEYYMERLMHLKLSRADKLIDEGNLTYYHKVMVVESLNILGDKTIQCLKNLNRVRNRSAHEMDRQISLADIELIGRPFGQEFTKYRRQFAEDLPSLLRIVLSMICRNLCFAILEFEKQVDA